MSFCHHCEGQRFDRARVLRALRQIRRELRGSECEVVLRHALDTVRSMEIPHLEFEDDFGDQIVH